MKKIQSNLLSLIFSPSTFCIHVLAFFHVKCNNSWESEITGESCISIILYYDGFWIVQWERFVLKLYWLNCYMWLKWIWLRGTCDEAVRTVTAFLTDVVLCVGKWINSESRSVSETKMIDATKYLWIRK